VDAAAEAGVWAADEDARDSASGLEAAEVDEVSPTPDPQPLRLWSLTLNTGSPNLQP